MGEDPKFNNTILTNIGHQMLTSIANGNRKITYTKAEAYTQDVSSITNETLQALTSLQGKELSTNLLVSNDNGNVITITANFENKGLTSDVVFNSIGWFAKLDTDDADRGITANQEYLIGITPANGAQTLVAPPADQSASQAISLNLNMTLSDAANVNMTVSDAGAVHFNQLYDQLAEYTTTSDLTKLLAGKADLGLSYTKAELDAKLLDLTTDTNGKVSADQVKALISDKANISDVYTKSQIDSDLSTRDAQINAKANASDVYTKSQIDSDLSARDTQIANATSLANQAQATANTKANASDVTEISGRLGKLEGVQTVDSPDFNSITNTGVYYITNNTPANIKNNPASQWGVLVVSSGNGQRISQVYYPDDGSPQWCRLLNGSNWLPWYQLSTKKDVSNATELANQAQTTANTKANASDVYTKEQVDGSFSTRDNNINSLINQVKQIDGETVISDAVDVNTLLGTIGQVTVYKLPNLNNTNTPPWLADKRGIMIVLNYDGNAKTQIWTPVGAGVASASSTDGTFGWRYWEGNNPPDWNRFVSASYVDGLHTDLQNQINANDNGTITTGYDWNTATPTNQSRTLQNAWIVDQAALKGAVDRMNNTDTNVSAISNKVNVDGPLYKYLTQFNHWSDLFDGYGVNGVTATNGSRLVAFKDDTNGGNTVGSNGAGIAFGGDDTKGVLSVDYGDHTARIAGGNGDKPAWSEDIAWKSDITSLQNTVNNIDSTRTPLVNGSAGDDLFAFKTSQIRLYPGNGSACKNLPPASNTRWFTVQYVFEIPNNDGIAIFRSPANEVWTIGNNGGFYGTGWVRVANSNDINSLQNTINQQSQTIQSLTTRLTNVENEISYIKANYIEGKQFPASQEAQAVAWENANPQGIAFITSN